VLLMYRRAYLRLPIFLTYVVWGAVSDGAMFFLHYRFPKQYLSIYIGELSLDSALQYAVLVELAWSVLRPYRALLPRWTVPGIAIGFLALGAAAWPFSDSRTFATYPGAWHFMAHLQQAITAERIVFFLALAGCSHLLSIGPQDRELQAASGLGFYSLVSLTGSVLHTHAALGNYYHTVDQIVAGSYLVCLVYWVVSFIQADAPRREFTPQMQGILTALGGAARAQRGQLVNSGTRDSR
jgi:hypothetical protein